jgi:hypothetical protein
MLQLLLGASTILAMDALLYVTLPESVATLMPGYRQQQGPLGVLRDYFQAHPERGYDIAPKRSTRHFFFGGPPYPVWSNSLGCFDRDWTIVPGTYFYFAGDSFVWGFSPYESKFATIFEKKSGIATLKCGVPHTGQLHQFSKFKEIVATVGHYPKHVVVFYFDNDFANDYAYPHTTVVDGWPIETREIDRQGRLYNRTAEQIRNSIRARTREEDARQALLEKIKDVLRRYSAVAHLVNFASAEMGTLFRRRAEAHKQAQAGDHGGEARQHFHALVEQQEANGVYRYLDYDIATRNKEVLIAWARDAKTHNYALTFVLIPPKAFHAEPEYYRELRQFLEQHKIEYIDLSFEFKRRNLRVDDLYWARDPHFSVKGNEIVGNLLVDKLAKESPHTRE